MPLSEYAAWEYGTQVFFVGLASYAVIVWTLKFNMLFFYQRVVNGLWVEKLILPAFGLVAASGVAIVLTLTLTCIPFRKLWQIWPDPGRESLTMDIGRSLKSDNVSLLFRSLRSSE
jgi:hypothetical protein